LKDLFFETEVFATNESEPGVLPLEMGDLNQLAVDVQSQRFLCAAA